MAFIIKPLVTEKMTKITDKSSETKTYKVKGEERTKKAETKYGFIVKPEANKLEIKKEVESARNSGSKTQDYWHVRGYYCIRAREVSRLR